MAKIAKDARIRFMAFGGSGVGDVAIQLDKLVLRLGGEDDGEAHTPQACSAASRARTVCALTARDGSAATAS